MATTATIPATAAQNSLVLANNRVSRRRRGSTNVSVVVPRTSVAVPGARSVMLMIVPPVGWGGTPDYPRFDVTETHRRRDVVAHHRPHADRDSLGTEWG